MPSLLISLNLEPLNPDLPPFYSKIGNMLIGKPGREAFVQLQIVGEVTDCSRGLSPHTSLWQASTTYTGRKITVREGKQ